MLPEADFVELNPNTVPSYAGNIVVIAAGTGLGEALMMSNGEAHWAISTEGGHADFAPSDQQQIGLLNYLMQKYDGHDSYEILLSGHGLINIYNYLKQVQFSPVNVSTENKILTDVPAAVIGMAGVEGNDKLCAEALIYDAESGNLALKCITMQVFIYQKALLEKSFRY